MSHQSLGGTCSGGTCACDAWFTGPSCALLNLQAPKDDQGGTCGANFDGYFSWGGRAIPDEQGQWHLFASFICDHENLQKWTTQSSSAHFVSSNATGPFEFAPEQCDEHEARPTEQRGERQQGGCRVRSVRIFVCRVPQPQHAASERVLRPNVAPDGVRVAAARQQEAARTVH